MKCMKGMNCKIKTLKDFYHEEHEGTRRKKLKRQFTMKDMKIG